MNSMGLDYPRCHLPKKPDFQKSAWPSGPQQRRPMAISMYATRQTPARRVAIVVAILLGSLGERVQVGCGFAVRHNFLEKLSMNALLRNALAVTVVAITTHASAQVTFYEQNGFQGRSFTTEKQIGNFERYGFNDRASSVVVVSERWEVCDDIRFSGRCVVLRPGRYPSLAAMGLNDRVSSVRAVSRNARIDERRYAPAPVAAQVTFYERENFGGRSFTTDRPVENFGRQGFNDRASSVDVVGA